MTLFDAYGHYYDLLYRDKDYEKEADYVAQLIRSNTKDAQGLLELGCGTGCHAEHFARRGFYVHGVEMSSTMLAKAEKRKLRSEVGKFLMFSRGDMRSVRIGGRFDAIISLFHVMSYQTTNADITASVNTAAWHLKEGGIFIFDVWYGPAVLTQAPEVRVKRLEDESVRITRIAEPVVFANDNVVDVEYQVLIEDKATRIIDQIQETHRMRYFFKPEILLLLDKVGLDLIGEQEWLTGRRLDCSTWSATFITKKR